MREDLPARCTIPGCEEPVYCICLCAKHYRLQRKERIEALRLVVPPTGCSIDDCDRPAHARGLCQTHYQRARRKKLHTPCSSGKRHVWTLSGKCLVCGIKRLRLA
jgi:hypothetical protein